jgi:hypothetical protein
MSRTSVPAAVLHGGRALCSWVLQGGWAPLAAVPLGPSGTTARGRASPTVVPWEALALRLPTIGRLSCALRFPTTGRLAHHLRRPSLVSRRAPRSARAPPLRVVQGAAGGRWREGTMPAEVGGGRRREDGANRRGGAASGGMGATDGSAWLDLRLDGER